MKLFLRYSECVRRLSSVASIVILLGSAHSSPKSLGEDGACETCRHTGTPSARSTSLLQRRHEFTQGKFPLDFIFGSRDSLAMAALHEEFEERSQSEIYADRADSDCSLGSGCSTDGAPSVRAVCILNPSGEKACWDACNQSHDVAEYQTGNIMLDIQVQDTINSIRTGNYNSVSCPWANSSIPAERSDGNQNSTRIVHGDGCHWHPPAECVQTFTYKGELYRDCPVADHHQPWCSHLADFQAGGWSNCKFVCEMDERYVDANGLMKQNYSEEDKEIIALAASLDDQGYKEVATLRSQYAMALLARRVVANMGCRVVNETALEELIPRHSGEHDVQTFAHLEHELYLACTGNATWLVHTYDQNVIKEESLLNIAQPLASEAGSTDLLSGDASSTGSTTEISEEGFKDVVQLDDQQELYKYIRRVISKLHGVILDESGLHGIAPFYNGEKEYQTLGELILEIEKTMQKPDGWVMKAPASVQQSMSGPDSSSDPTELPLDDPEVAKRVSERLAQVGKGGSRTFRECPEKAEEVQALNHTAWNVPLNQQGYETLLNGLSGNFTDCGMMLFVVRLVKDIGCNVKEESGLKGLVPFYSGTQGRNDFLELKRELLGECKTIGSWIQRGTELKPSSALEIGVAQKKTIDGTSVVMASQAGALAHGAKKHSADLLSIARIVSSAVSPKKRKEHHSAAMYSKERKRSTGEHRRRKEKSEEKETTKEKPKGKVKDHEKQSTKKAAATTKSKTKDQSSKHDSKDRSHEKTNGDAHESRKKQDSSEGEKKQKTRHKEKDGRKPGSKADKKGKKRKENKGDKDSFLCRTLGILC